MRVHLILLFGLSAVLAGCSKEPSSPVTDAQTRELPPPATITRSSPLVVYTTFNGKKIKPVLDAYKAESGTNYQLLVDGSLDNLNAVDDATTLPNADIYVANSFAELSAFAEADVFRPVRSNLIDAHIPEVLRDSEGRWVAISKRVRVIVYNTDLVETNELRGIVDYAALGDETWSNRLCLSSSRNAGNQLLVAFLIADLGVRNAELAVRHWRGNFAAPPFSTDRDLIAAVAAGQCALGIVDSNTALKFAASNQNAPVAPHLFAIEEEALFDFSGAGVSRHAHDADGAIAFLEWLTSATPAALYAAQDSEMPSNPNASRGIARANWAENVAVQGSFSELGFLQEDAIKLIERARYP
ncbi:MAG: extracellular solute-binding protein [Woeseiales bacterium]|jgi:iron(III) transport system substrate-binding protein